MVENYSIKSRSHCCHLTGEAFQEDQPFIAAIFPDTEASGYIRLDYSVAAWDTREDETQPFSFWRSHYKPPVKEEETQVTPHDPQTLFAKLIEDDEAHTENARFILAAMLERKKIIRETDTQQLPTGLLRIYENRKTGDVFIVKDPQIALADVESIQEEVQQLLDPEKYGLEAPATDKASAEVAEGEEVREATAHNNWRNRRSPRRRDRQRGQRRQRPIQPRRTRGQNMK
ncbi:MAG: hypothetical protein ACSHYB_08145 [Roseibacillus sp.]